jgi:hypothetical protein
LGYCGWEFKLAQELEDMPEVFAYVKNQSLGFTIPYTVNGDVVKQIHALTTRYVESVEGTP